MSKRVLIPYRHAKKVKAYEDAVQAAGMEPTAVCVSDRMPAGGFSGLLLTGGSDVNPQRYGAAAGPYTDAPDDERDGVELEQIGAALARGLPIFGICRGLQLLNVYYGGTLIQHIGAIAKHDPEKEDHSGPAHEVRFEPGTRLAEIARSGRWQVNSRHHQAVEKTGAGLRISARDAEDGTVEGLESMDQRFVVAVQWHPEDQILKHPEHLRLFQGFAAAL
jgi:putative glutamine amidotransferase